MTDRIRIAWNIDGQQGHGTWFPHKDYETLLSHVKRCNEEFGRYTHWIEYEQ